MKLSFRSAFTEKLADQIEYISKDKPQAARKFKTDLITALNKLSPAPYSARKSIYFNNQNIRDFIFKGYVITYEIDEKNNTISVFSIIKMQKGIKQ
jgi:plasmid stabilization system protein ParE